MTGEPSEDSEVASLRRRIGELEERLQQADSRRDRQARHSQAVQQLRERVWEMRSGQDLHLVVETIGAALREVGVPHHEYGVNLIAADGAIHQWTSTGRKRSYQELPADPGSVIHAFRAGGEVVYRRDLLAEDPHGELELYARLPQGVRRSVIDVPFDRGTLAVNAFEPEAFSEDHVALLRRIGRIVDNALQRWEDLDRLDRRRVELAESTQRLHERERLLRAFHETSKALLTSLDLDHILDTLSMQIIEAGVFRSTMIALVDHDSESVRVVRSFLRERRADGTWAPVENVDRRIGLEYNLTDTNITAEVARTGVMQVLAGWDGRYEQGLRDITDPRSVAYVRPVVHAGRTVAVLATGSDPEERDEMLRRIEDLSPFFDLVAIALHHARLYVSLQERERELRQLQKMEVMGELTAGIAHNFNNLMQAVSGNLELALEEIEGEPKERVEDARRVVLKQAELVRQLMAYSQRRALAPHAAVDVAGLLDSVSNICRSTFDRRIDLQLHVASDLPPLLGDASQLEQALLNLCLNARDAVLEPGIEEPRVDLVAENRHTDGHVDIVVRDNGSGITRADRERIFDPFYTTKDVGSGTGLGLSIVHGIVRQHGGQIRCESQLGGGTEFRLSLPTTARPRPEPPESDRPAPARGDERILVVEDEEAVRTTVALVLDRLGYDVLVAADGEEGLALLARQERPVDLILLDLSMPRMSGDQMLDHLDPETAPPVILFTGYATPAAVQERVAAVLEKPLGPRILMRCVRAVLDGTPV
jgi:signal transduction histidine kinase